MSWNAKRWGLTFFLSLVIASPMSGQVRLPRLISDGMVLQRDAHIKIWGWAAAAEKISIGFLDSVYRTLANEKGGELKSFAIAGPDRRFVWATAKIANKNVAVWSELVANPVAVRYAWADNPEGANLYNAEGLPASPFRTDE